MIEIVIGQRGWVWVGRVRRDGDDVVIEGARCVRRWGTERGLGQLHGGPLPTTELDDPATIRLHPLAIVGRQEVDQEAWSRVLGGAG